MNSKKKKKNNKGATRNISSDTDTGSAPSDLASALVSTGGEENTETPLSLLSLTASPSSSIVTPFVVQDGIKYRSKMYADTARVMKEAQEAMAYLTPPTTTAMPPSVPTSSTSTPDENENELTTTSIITGTSVASLALFDSTRTCCPTNKQQQRCYHGSSKEAYTNPKYLQAFESILVPALFLQDYKNRRLLKDSQFCNYAFARAVDAWFQYDLGSPYIGKDDEVGSSLIVTLLITALNSRYKTIPKNSEGVIVDLSTVEQKIAKYTRDLTTYRGIINVLDRETNPKNKGIGSCGCTCMHQSKQKAKTMEKVSYCYGCHDYFPKDQLRLCKKCKSMKYCSRKCQIANWPDHKPTCQGMLKQVQWGTKAHENVWKEISGVL